MSFRGDSAGNQSKTAAVNCSLPSGSKKDHAVPKEENIGPDPRQPGQEVWEVIPGKWTVSHTLHSKITAETFSAQHGGSGQLCRSVQAGWPAKWGKRPAVQIGTSRLAGKMGEAASCANWASRLAGKMGEAASCTNWASRLAGKMGEAASCENWASPSRVYSSPDPRQEMDVLCEPQPVKLLCQNPKMVLQTFRSLPQG